MIKPYSKTVFFILSSVLLLIFSIKFVISFQSENMPSLLSIDEVNKLSKSEFEEKFKNVVELWPSAAQEVSADLPFASAKALVDKFWDYLEHSNSSVKEQILISHPDLAGKLAQEELSPESANEQAQAGLDKLTAEQKRQLQDLNDKYKEKFGFPFVICVRVANKIEKILEGLNARLPNNKTTELKTGIDEVKKICEIRICDIVKCPSE